MATKDRSTLATDIATNLADNTSGDISALDLRTVFLDTEDSNFNLTDDDTDDITEGATNLFCSPAEKSLIRDWNHQRYVDTIDFTAGTTTNLTMPAASLSDSEANVRVFFEGAPQASDAYSISGTTITFASAIPLGIGFVEIYVFA